MWEREGELGNEDRKGKAGKAKVHVNLCLCQQKLLRDAYAFNLL
jgi:hypothetical protein